MMASHSPEFQRLLKRNVFLPFLALAILVFGLGWLFDTASLQTAKVNQTLHILADAERVMTIALDAETGLRGHALTQDARFLKPYRDALREFPAAIGQLETAEGDHPIQQRRVAEIRDSFNAWAIGASPFAPLASQSERVAHGLIRKAQMDGIRGQVNDIVNDAQSQLEVGEDALRGTSALLVVALTMSFILIGGLLAFQSYQSLTGLSDRYEQALDRVEQQARELRISKDELEDRVVERTRDLTAANRELDSFCGMVAHDLRAPLRWISASAAIFKEDYGKLVPKEGVAEIERISQSVSRLSGLIDGLLELARLGRVNVSKSNVDLTLMAREIAEELEARDWNHPVEFEIQLDLVAKGDPLLLRLLLQNLMENACKFSSKTGRGRVRIASDPVSGVFSVVDNGVGFDMTLQEKLFKPFERLHSQTEFDGNGIGLANAYRIVQRHGGKLWAESKPGDGASFFFTL